MQINKTNMNGISEESHSYPQLEKVAQRRSDVFRQARPY